MPLEIKKESTLKKVVELVSKSYRDPIDYLVKAHYTDEGILYVEFVSDGEHYSYQVNPQTGGIVLRNLDVQNQKN